LVAGGFPWVACGQAVDSTLVTAARIDGEHLAAELRAEVEKDARALEAAGVVPGLATLLVGDDYASAAYERRVRRLSEELGCRYVCEHLSGDAEEAEVLAIVGKLNADPRVSGILVLRPLPAHVDEGHVYRTLDPLKDIEAVHPDNAGLLALGQPRFVPSTPASIFWMLDRYVADTGRDPKTFYNGLDLVLVGRSNNVGKPALWLGLARNATVISAHKFTAQAGRLEAHTRAADILVVAAGLPRFVTGDMVKPGAIVIDVGINPEKDSETGKVRMVGDVDFPSVAEVAEAISPVPGGVGPITDVFLLRNAVHAARLQARLHED
jgi:methylenetetrahydrofolate dehydrogenase (NADP+)/methenyltetrahydrofolate cyclohydrolase